MGKFGLLKTKDVQGNRAVSVLVFLLVLQQWLTQITAAKLEVEPLRGLNNFSPPPPSGFFTRGMLKVNHKIKRVRFSRWHWWNFLFLFQCSKFLAWFEIPWFDQVRSGRRIGHPWELNLAGSLWSVERPPKSDEFDINSDKWVESLFSTTIRPLSTFMNEIHL